MGLLVLFLGFLTHPASSQSTRFDNSIMSLGLVVRQLGGVKAIDQDGRGFIWVGAENGLGRYDGVNLRLYQTDNAPGLPSNYVWDLAVDPQGDIWIATGGGLAVYRPRTDTFDRIDNIGGQFFLADTFTSIDIVDGKVYLGTTFGLNIIDLASQTMTPFVPDSPAESPAGSNSIHDTTLDQAGNVWMATALSGLVRFNPLSGEAKQFSHTKDNPYSIRSNQVRTVFYDSSGRIWAGTYGGGINILVPGSDKFTHLRYPRQYGNDQNSAVMDIAEDADGDIWVSVDQQGLFRFDKDLSLVQHFSHSSSNRNSLISNQTRAIFEDANQDLWVGIFPFGISFLDRSRDNIRTYQADGSNPEALTNNAILSLHQDDQGIIWVGTEGGLNAFDPATEIFTRYVSEFDNPHALAANAVLAIEEDANGDLWVGTWSGGLHRFDPEARMFHRYEARNDDPHSLGDPFVWSVLVDSDNILWVGTETGGLHRYRPETDDFQRYLHDTADPSSIAANYISDIIEDSQGRLWIATFGGLNMFDKETENFQQFRPEPGNEESLSTLAIKTVFEDSRGYIWAGGHDSGVNRVDPNSGTIKRFSVADGLPSATISSIQEDLEGYIWLATNNGLARLHPDTFDVSLVNVEHGLIGGTYNRDASLLDSEGRLYFGSTEGITAFKPDDVTVSSRTHPIRITDFRILNQPVPIGGPDSPLEQSILTTETLRLNHSDNVFSFDFVLLNYRNSHLNEYAYKLEGFDTSWNYVKQRNSATYTNLDPGRYIFQVQAKAPGEEWVLGDHTISIDIAPPPWFSWWAYCIYFVLAGASIYAVYAVGRLKKTSNNYKALSVTDPLTGTYNRAGIAQIVQGLFANQEMKNGVSVMLMDIDNFKPINDCYGHDVGDRVLMDIADIVRAVVRQGDRFGRWGGEEFILLCPSSTEAGAQHLADKIRAAIADHPFISGDGPLHITISVGIALVAQNESFAGALKRADRALYRAKTGGRNRTVLAEAA